MSITVRHQRFKVRLDKRKFYQIFELDFRQDKKAFSPIFKGTDYHYHLPETDKNSYPKYEIQRIRCIPGTHELSSKNWLLIETRFAGFIFFIIEKVNIFPIVN